MKRPNPENHAAIWESPDPSSYASAKRDVRLDTLRGLMLVSMTVNHLLWFAFRDNWFFFIYKLTYQPVGFVSAAEGFVFLSGLVAGMVYGRIRFRDGSSKLRRRAFGRVRDIYLTHMFVFVVLLAASAYLGQVSGAWERLVPLFFTQELMALGLGSVLLYQPTLLDILPMYCLFLAIVPFVINQIARGRGSWILLGSGAIWMVAQLNVKEEMVSFFPSSVPVNLGYFDIFAWQFLFVIGLITGVWRCTHKESFVPPRYRLTLLMTSLVIGSLLFVQRFGRVIDLNLIPHVESLTKTATLAPLRLLNFMVVAYLVARAGARFERLSSWQWLSFLGQHSLQVFAFQVLIVFAVVLFHDQLASMSVPLMVLTIGVLVLSLSLPAYIHKCYRDWKKGKNEGN